MTTVTLSTDERSVTMTGEQFDAAVDAITAGGRAPIPTDGRFAGDFLDAPDVERIAAQLIASRDRFAFLRDWQGAIAYAWKRKGGKKGGRAVLGRCQTLSGYAKHKAGRSYLIWLGADTCREVKLTIRQLEALIFHELCHLGPGEEDEETGVVGPPVVVGHDYEGFLAELEEYGAWAPDLVAARGAFEQLPLFGRGGGNDALA